MQMEPVVVPITLDRSSFEAAQAALRNIGRATGGISLPVTGATSFANLLSDATASASILSQRLSLAKSDLANMTASASVLQGKLSGAASKLRADLESTNREMAGILAKSGGSLRVKITHSQVTEGGRQQVVSVMSGQAVSTLKDTQVKQTDRIVELLNSLVKATERQGNSLLKQAFTGLRKAAVGQVQGALSERYGDINLLKGAVTSQIGQLIGGVFTSAGAKLPSGIGDGGMSAKIVSLMKDRLQAFDRAIVDAVGAQNIYAKKGERVVAAEKQAKKFTALADTGMQAEYAKLFEKSRAIAVEIQDLELRIEGSEKISTTFMGLSNALEKKETQLKDVDNQLEAIKQEIIKSDPFRALPALYRQVLQDLEIPLSQAPKLSLSNIPDAEAYFDLVSKQVLVNRETMAKILAGEESAYVTLAHELEHSIQQGSHRKVLRDEHGRYLGTEGVANTPSRNIQHLRERLQYAQTGISPYSDRKLGELLLPRTQMDRAAAEEIISRYGEGWNALPYFRQREELDAEIKAKRAASRYQARKSSEQAFSIAFQSTPPHLQSNSEKIQEGWKAAAEALDAVSEAMNPALKAAQKAYQIAQAVEKAAFLFVPGAGAVKKGIQIAAPIAGVGALSAVNPEIGAAVHTAGAHVAGVAGMGLGAAGHAAGGAIAGAIPESITQAAGAIGDAAQAIGNLTHVTGILQQAAGAVGHLAADIAVVVGAGGAIGKGLSAAADRLLPSELKLLQSEVKKLKASAEKARATSPLHATAEVFSAFNSIRESQQKQAQEAIKEAEKRQKEAEKAAKNTDIAFRPAIPGGAVFKPVAMQVVKATDDIVNKQIIPQQKEIQQFIGQNHKEQIEKIKQQGKNLSVTMKKAVAEVGIDLKASFRSVSKAIGSSFKGLFANFGADILGAIGLYSIGDAVVNVVREGLQTALEEASARLALDSFGGKGTYDKITKQANELGLRVQGVAQATKGFIANTADVFSIEQQDSILKGIMEGLAVMSPTLQQAESAFLAITQTLSRGTASLEELNQLGDAMPVALKAMAKEMGMTTGELRQFIAAGKLGGKEALENLSTGLSKMAHESGALAKQLDSPIANMNRLANTNRLWMESMGRGFLQVAGLGAKALNAFFNNAALQNAIVVLGAGAIASLISQLLKVPMVLKGIAMVIELVRSASVGMLMGLATNPFVWVTAAAAGLAALATQQFQTNEQFRDGVILAGDMAAILGGDVWGGITDIWNSLTSTIGRLYNSLKDVLDTAIEFYRLKDIFKFGGKQGQGEGNWFTDLAERAKARRAERERVAPRTLFEGGSGANKDPKAIADALAKQIETQTQLNDNAAKLARELANSGADAQRNLNKGATDLAQSLAKEAKDFGKTLAEGLRTTFKELKEEISTARRGVEEQQASLSLDKFKAGVEQVGAGVNSNVANYADVIKTLLSEQATANDDKRKTELDLADKLRSQEEKRQQLIAERTKIISEFNLGVTKKIEDHKRSNAETIAQFNLETQRKISEHQIETAKRIAEYNIIATQKSLASVATATSTMPGAVGTAGAAGTAAAFPVPGGTFTGGGGVFGAARDSGKRTHKGQDIAAPAGTPVLSTVGGLVKSIFLLDRAAQSWGVVIERADKMVERYLHITPTSGIRAGTAVTAGQQIGIVSPDDRISQGAHLHYEVHLDGRALNPLAYLKSLKAGSGKLPAAGSTAGAGMSEQELFKRLIVAESGGESLTGQALVARSILNRQQLIKSGAVSPGHFNAKSESLTDILTGRNQYEGLRAAQTRQYSPEQLGMAAQAIELARNPAKLKEMLGNMGQLILATGFNTPAAQGTGMKGKVTGRFGGHNFIIDSASARGGFTPNEVVVAGAQAAAISAPTAPTIPQLKAPSIKAPTLDIKAEIQSFTGAIKGSFEELNALAEKEKQLTDESIKQRLTAQIEAAKAWSVQKVRENDEVKASLELEKQKTEIIQNNTLLSDKEIEAKIKGLQQDQEMAILAKDSLSVREQIEKVLKSSLLMEQDRAVILENLAASEALVLKTAREKYEIETAIAAQQERQAKIQEAAALSRERATAMESKLQDAQRQFLSPREQISFGADRELRRQQEALREQFAGQPDLLREQLAAAQAAASQSVGIDLQLFDYEQQKQEIEGVAGLISSSIGGAIQGVFDGGKDVFQKFIKQIGDGFINMAVEIIQGFVKNAIMNAFAPPPVFGGDGGGGGFSGGSLIGAGLNLLTSIVPAFADGGTFDYSRPSLALLHPGEEVLSYQKGDAQRYRSEQLIRQGGHMRMSSPHHESFSGEHSMMRAMQAMTVNKNANVTVNVRATDADSFRRSQSSIMQDMARRSRDISERLD